MWKNETQTLACIFRLCKLFKSIFFSCAARDIFFSVDRDISYQFQLDPSCDKKWSFKGSVPLKEKRNPFKVTLLSVRLSVKRLYLRNAWRCRVGIQTIYLPIRYNNNFIISMREMFVISGAAGQRPTVPKYFHSYEL